MRPLTGPKSFTATSRVLLRRGMKTLTVLSPTTQPGLLPGRGTPCSESTLRAVWRSTAPALAFSCRTASSGRLVDNTGDDTFIGNKYNDLVQAGAGNDVLVGLGGSDGLYGDAGDDTFNSTTDYSGLDGTGAGAGNDLMDGGSGFDTVRYGGKASEFQITKEADGSLTVVDRLGYYGIDTLVGIESLQFDDQTFDFRPPPPPPVLPVVIAGTAWSDSLHGNALDNVIYGYGGGDLLAGGDGNDVLYGGAGSDQNMHGEAGNDVLYGGDDFDRLFGGDGNDTLYGGKGADFLYGGAGKDAFVFNSSPASGRDTIYKFSVADDTIKLDNACFKAVGRNGALKSGAFHASKAGVAHDASDRVIYDTDSGRLSYDADGTGSGRAIEFAQLSKGLKLTYHDFFVL